MKNRTVVYFIGILFLLNIFAWQEVFVLAGNSYLKIYFLDVGQGDAAFIETPQRHQILIDAGPDSIILQKLQEIMPLKDMSLDLVILTHPEKDHLTGLLDVLQRYKIDYILQTGVVRQTPEYAEWVKLLEQAQQNGAEIIIAESQQEIKAGDVVIDTLHPFENLSGKEMKNTSNDSCIVSRLVFYKNSFLFTGDITSKVEEELIKQNSHLVSTVLKVAHHGSKYSTSEEFLENVEPKIAVISVAKDNYYGHPALEVLQRLEKFGIEIKRTDQDGDIKIVSDGNNFKIINGNYQKYERFGFPNF